MAEKDPRTNRAFKQPAETRDLSDEDPLVELARIVGEDNSFYSARSETAKAGRDEALDRKAFSADLESELLNELESSFSPRKAEPASAAARRGIVRPLPTPPEPQPEAEQGDDLMRSIEEQLGAFERRNQSAQPVRNAAPVQPHWSNRSEQLRGRQPEKDVRDAGQEEEQNALSGVSVQPVNRGQQRGVLRAAAAPDPGAVAAGRRAELGPVRGDGVRNRPESAPDPGAAPRRNREDRVSAQPEQQVSLRPDRAAPPAFVSGASAGWNEIAEPDQRPNRGRSERTSQAAAGASGLRTTFGGTEDARGTPTPQAAARSAHIEAELTRELESGYSDPSLPSDWPDEPLHAGQDEPRIAAAGGYDGDVLAASPRRRRSRKGLLVLASLLMLAVIGGGVAAYLRSGEEVASGPPPVIAAEEGAVKIQPPAPQQQAAEETVGEAVYNRVAGATEPTQEQVVESAEEPEEISRIVLPPPEPPTPSADAAQSEIGTAAVEATSGAEPSAGPRRVRTFLVRPDGTIVSSEDAPAVADAASAAPAEAAAAEPAQEQQVASLPQERPAEPVTVPATPIREDAEAAGEAAPAEPAAAEPATATAEAAIADLAPTQSPETSAVPADAEAAPAEAAPAQVASAPAAPPDASAASGNFVQISSQRSMDQAQSSFAGMKRQFPSILGTLSADIREADLGAKGTYYRVRVGPYATRGEAIGVCEELKAAGGSCFVTQ